MNFWQALTDLGDAAFLASFALGITVWLAARSSLLLAAAWIAVFGAAILIVAATKLAFIRFLRIWRFPGPTCSSGSFARG